MTGRSSGEPNEGTSIGCSPMDLAVAESVPRRVLFVDDERVIADTLVAIFIGKGYQARAAYSAEQAVEIVAVWTPGLAVIDVYLPGMNGIDFAKALQQSVPACRAILFSGRASVDLTLSSAAGEFELLAKPLHPGDLLQVADDHFSTATSESALA